MPATISPVSGALGNKETASLTAYTVTPEAGSTVTQIVERINGTIVNTFNNPASLSRTLTVPNATYDTLTYFANHTASVTVTDSNGAQTVTTYSFDKTLANTASLLEARKANEDAKNRIAAKKDALAAQVGLSAGATFDAISAQLASGAFKKFATGTTSTGASNISYGGQTAYPITVQNLSFKPSTVILWRAGTNSEFTVFHLNADFISSAGQQNVVYQASTSTQVRDTLNANYYVNDVGFVLPGRAASITYDWIAYE